MTKIPNKPKMMKYQTATSDQAIKIKQSAIGTSRSHFKAVLSLSVIFQIRAADPENDVGAEAITFSDAKRLLMIYYT